MAAQMSSIETDENVFSFAFIADPQIGINSPEGLRGANSDKQRLELAIDFVNQNEIEFVIFGGDQIDSIDSQEQLDLFMECLSKLKVPYYGVIGNHEQGLSPDSKSLYIQRDGAPVRFSMVHKNAFFVGTNILWIRGDCGPECQQKEWAFLRNEFDRAPADCSHRFVVTHWPLFNRHPFEEESYWNMPNRPELLDFFKEKKVSCVLAGHLHQDLDACWDGLCLLASVGTSLPLQYPEELAFKVITVFPGGWSARRVSVEKT